MSVWDRLGFSENLYATPPLPGTASGSRLLVGRDAEIEELREHWASYDTHFSVEGANGVGKTSLVTVAAYREMEAREAARQPIILPIDEVFQLTSESGGFENRVYLALARALLAHEDRLAKLGYFVSDLSGLRQWMDSPTNTTKAASGSVMGFGVGGTYGVASSTSAGFTDNGLVELVTSNLRSIFPTMAAGGFIGILDNMELLSTSKDARRRLEEMRDSILSIPGVRWVLCGANGIVRSAVGSPRLTGRVADPLKLEPLRHDDAPEVIRRRIDEYKTREDAEPPVDPDGFLHLYTVLNNNLRIALKHAEEFTKWYDKNARGSSKDDRAKLLEVWLTDQADAYAADAGSLTRRTWELFDDLILFGGSCSPSEFAEFGFSSNAAMRPYVKTLEEANLVNSAIDEDDSRRRTIEITPNGWLVHYKRSGYQGRTA
jgi:hypothetical protein